MSLVRSNCRISKRCFFYLNWITLYHCQPFRRGNRSDDYVLLIKYELSKYQFKNKRKSFICLKSFFLNIPSNYGRIWHYISSILLFECFIRKIARDQNLMLLHKLLLTNLTFNLLHLWLLFGPPAMAGRFYGLGSVLPSVHPSIRMSLLLAGRFHGID